MPLTIPAAKANEFDVAAPGVDTDILASDITPSNTPSICRVAVVLATASVFKARVTQGATTFDVKLNSGAALVASCLYVFDIPWEEGDSINFQVETDGIIQVLKAHEVGGAQ